MAARAKDHNRILKEANDVYYTIVDEADSAATYVGKALIGSSTADAVWQIQKISDTGTVTSVQWPNADDSFAFIWANRTSYTYS